MTKTIQINDIVQLDPIETGNPAFSACLMVVSEIYDWGVQGYVTVPDKGQAYYRAKHGTFERTGGKAVWVSA